MKSVERSKTQVVEGTWYQVLTSYVVESLSVQRTDGQLLVPAANKPGDDEIAMTWRRQSLRPAMRTLPWCRGNYIGLLGLY
jgi:hypothetical protein